MYVLFRILRQKERSQLFKKISGLVLLQQNETILTFGEIAQNRKYFEEILTPSRVVVYPVEQRSWHFFEFGEDFSFDDAYSDFGMK